ncbi:hypothetical protein HYH02_014407 [Chlamydomonas schloesseri]|uniref:Protein kinase domain-containing protein n=1 Tax=Chlamydomonas schloesseri TaxID=2026947 RepID=A0A835SYT6_9CHLO|nr:hypothetical protein HYH02_014407 [Chlamydomonas schloesseri]|eukprot:KAG2428391.1 hypothetical protein HYH02_014407 [Chlamydomonas schloesseri]
MSNISLPTKPSPQRMMLPTADDASPFAWIYRNVTLAGGGARMVAAGGTTGTELDLRLRRNVFRLTRRLPNSTAISNSSTMLPPAVLTMSDLTTVNMPQGAPDAWPLGIMSGWFYYVTADASRAEGGAQVQLLRHASVYTAAELKYTGFWFLRVSALTAEESAAAAWLRAVISSNMQVPDADGRLTRYAAQYDPGGVTEGIATTASGRERVIGYNSSSTPRVLRTPPTPFDYDVFALPPAGTRMPPPTSVALAFNASQLLALLREAWAPEHPMTDAASGAGERVIALMRNMSLDASNWPAAGAALSYNVTLLGPARGDPVWLTLDGGVSLVRSSSTVATMVTCQLVQLWLVGFGPVAAAPLVSSASELSALGWAEAANVSVPATASRRALRQQQTQPASSSGIETWRRRCANTTSSALGFSILYELYNCTVVVPPGTLDLLGAANLGARSASSSSSPSSLAASASPGSVADEAAAIFTCGGRWGVADASTSASAAAALVAACDLSTYLNSTPAAAAGNGNSSSPLAALLSGGGAAAAALSLLRSKLVVAGQASFQLRSPTAASSSAVGSASHVSAAAFANATLRASASAAGGGAAAASGSVLMVGVALLPSAAVESGPLLGASVWDTATACGVPALAVELDAALAAAVAAAAGTPPPGAATAAAPSPSTDSRGALVGAVVGGVVGGALVVAAVLAAMVCIRRRSGRGEGHGSGKAAAAEPEAGSGGHQSHELQEGSGVAAAAGAVGQGGGKDTRDPGPAVAVFLLSTADVDNASTVRMPVAAAAADSGPPVVDEAAIAAAIFESATTQQQESALPPDSFAMSTNGGGGQRSWYMGENLVVPGHQLPAAAAAAAALPAAAGRPHLGAARGTSESDGAAGQAAVAATGGKGPTSGGTPQAGSGAIPPMLASGGGGVAGARLMMTQQIEAMILSAAKKVNATGDGRSHSVTAAADSAAAEAAAARRVLGRGAHGVVYVSAWRGLPAAVKLMTFSTVAEVAAHGPPSEEAVAGSEAAAAAAAAAAANLERRRVRLAREVALTITLRHANVVPSYHYFLDFVPAEVAARGAGGLAELLRITAGDGHEDLVPVGDGGAGPDGCVPADAALRLRIVMQYCEGGTLGSALCRGEFGGGGGGGGAGGEGGRSSAACYRPEPRVPPGSWDQCRPAGNLALAVLAALDVARGLAFLHRHNVVHSDLNDNNILLKRVTPRLRTAGASGGSDKNNTSAAGTGTSHGGGTPGAEGSGVSAASRGGDKAVGSSSGTTADTAALRSGGGGSSSSSSSTPTSTVGALPSAAVAQPPVAPLPAAVSTSALHLPPATHSSSAAHDCCSLPAGASSSAGQPPTASCTTLGATSATSASTLQAARLTSATAAAAAAAASSSAHHSVATATGGAGGSTGGALKAAAALLASQSAITAHPHAQVAVEGAAVALHGSLTAALEQLGAGAAAAGAPAVPPSLPAAHSVCRLVTDVRVQTLELPPPEPTSTAAAEPADTNAADLALHVAPASTSDDSVAADPQQQRAAVAHVPASDVAAAAGQGGYLLEEAAAAAADNSPFAAQAAPAIASGASAAVEGSRHGEQQQQQQQQQQPFETMLPGIPIAPLQPQPAVMGLPAAAATGAQQGGGGGHGGAAPAAGNASGSQPSTAGGPASPPADDFGVLDEEEARRLLCFTFKIADFGLSVEMQGPNQTHVSNLAQGTPFFAAPEVVAEGRMSPAADVYSFGIVLWLLLHGYAMGQIRALLPRSATIPVGPLLCRNASRALPRSAADLLQRCLAVAPARRPAAAELPGRLEALLQDVAGPAMAHALMSAERRDA